MAFDLSKLQANPQPVPVAPAITPAPAVLINRPSTQRPVVPVTEALAVTTIEGPAAAHALLEYVDTEGDEVADPKDAVAEPAIVTSAPAVCSSETPPRARRGRPRKNPATIGGADTAEATPTATEPGGAPAPDPLAPAVLTASRCAPSAGDLAAAVSALLQARAAISAALLSLGGES